MSAHHIEYRIPWPRDVLRLRCLKIMETQGVSINRLLQCSHHAWWPVQRVFKRITIVGWAHCVQVLVWRRDTGCAVTVLHLKIGMTISAAGANVVHLLLLVKILRVRAVHHLERRSWARVPFNSFCAESIWLQIILARLKGVCSHVRIHLHVWSLTWLQGHVLHLH